MRRVAEQALRRGSGEGRFWVRVYAPVLEPRRMNWFSRVDNPLWWDTPRQSGGATALQAFYLGLSRLSMELYASPQYGLGPPRLEGASDHDVGLPAVRLFLDAAPFPFSRSRVRGQARSAVVNDAGWDARLLAEEVFGVAGTRKRVRARIYAPRPRPGGVWSCAVSVTSPLGMRAEGQGRSGLEAVVAGLTLLSHHLYGSRLYRAGRLEWPAEAARAIAQPGSSLVLPAVAELLNIAPYPF